MSRLLLSLIALLTASSLSAATVEISGIYQGQDLFVRNPKLDDGSGHCAARVLVNGQPTADRLDSHAFAVDLGAFELALGSQVVVVIETKSDCGVKVINPQVLEVRSTCTYAFSGLDLEGQSLSWKTNGESGALPFVVQQYRWGRWSVVGEVAGKGGGVENSYAIAVDVHHGENRFRIYQQDDESRNYSDPITVVNEIVSEVRITTEKVKKTLDFSEETEYEVYNAYGQLELEGSGASVDVKDLDKGTYYVNYGNHTGEAFRKR